MAELWEMSQDKLVAKFALKSRVVDRRDRRALTFVVSEALFRRFLTHSVQEGLTWDEKVRRLLEAYMASGDDNSVCIDS